VERFDLPLASPGVGPDATLADLTSFRIGGRPGKLLDCTDQDSLIQAIQRADEAQRPLLVLGGGSNLLANQYLDGLTVVRDRRSAAWTGQRRPDQLSLVVQAGASWDALAALSVERGWSGLAALSGVPGSVGATPVQNVGAYGADVSQVIQSLRAFDRRSGTTVELDQAALGFGYRDSVLKRSLVASGDLTPRWVVLDVTFALELGTRTEPVRYGQVALALGVDQGQAAPLSAIRRTVLEVRRQKGMVLDAADHDTWSAGSFFTNPIITTERAAALPAAAPRYRAGDGLVKTSAAWLIAACGVERGQGLRAGARATTSGKHLLALTNRGGATDADILELAAWIAGRVRDRFGIELTREPVVVPRLSA
jgi:UDP-N-acetylmuramate dehydrogenase